MTCREERETRSFWWREQSIDWSIVRTIEGDPRSGSKKKRKGKETRRNLRIWVAWLCVTGKKGNEIKRREGKGRRRGGSGKEIINYQYE
jgi:hypothetical protein